MGKRGIQHIHAYCVDNCLVKVADPVFIGFSASKSVDIATKVVRKRNSKESVGLILQKNGKPDVVEYSEIDTADAEATDSKNPDLLKFRAANIVNHYYSYKFLESIPEWAKKLPHHVARKKIPYVNTETGETIKPEKPNGIKLEQFVFDCFPFLTLEKFACMEVKREDEFSPLKNARGTGEDDPDTSKQDIMTQGKKWVQAAGATVVGEQMSDGIEVSPLISYVSLLRQLVVRQPLTRSYREVKASSSSTAGQSRRQPLSRARNRKPRRRRKRLFKTGSWLKVRNYRHRLMGYSCRPCSTNALLHFDSKNKTSHELHESMTCCLNDIQLKPFVTCGNTHSGRRAPHAGTKFRRPLTPVCQD